MGARISMAKFREGVTINRFRRPTAAADETVQDVKRTAFRTAPAAVDNNTLAPYSLSRPSPEPLLRMMLQRFQQLRPVGQESLPNPTSLRISQVAKQPKYNGKPSTVAPCPKRVQYVG